MSRTPRGILPPSRAYLSGILEEVDDLDELLLGLLDARHVGERDALAALVAACLRAAERAQRAPPAVARRIAKMMIARISSVGPKPSRICARRPRPESGALALISTFLALSSASSVLSVGSAGWLVWKRVNCFLSTVTARLNSPSIFWSVIVTWLTLLPCTSCRNCGE